jgi:hypothetical protein
MNDLQVIQQNLPFLGSVYNLQVLGFLASGLVVVVVWELIWKAFALWRAARLKNVVWFLVMITVNSAGILPIIYLLRSRTAYRKLLAVEEKGEMKNIAEEVLAKKTE